MTSIKIVAIIAFISCFFHNGISQNIQYLQNTGVIDSVYSNTLNQYRTFYVQVPDSYDPSSSTKYPVVYLVDGESLLTTAAVVQSYYSGGFTPEMIIVGISNANNRIRDLTPTKITEFYGRPMTQESGGAANFIDFIRLELIPAIEKSYPVTEFRTLIGHSHGGLFTIYCLLNAPDLFSNYISIDPSLYWDNQTLLKEAKGKLSKHDYNGKSLFISLGGQLDMANPDVTLENVMQDQSENTLFARSNIMFKNIVTQTSTNGLSFDWKFYPDDLHGTIPFPSIKDGLIANFKWFQMEQTDKFNSPDTPAAQLSEIVNHRAKKLQDYFKYEVAPYPEDLLNALGYMSLDMEQVEKSKMFFEFAIKFYPKSANSYDSMADFYERTGNKNKALEFVTKAFEISNSDYHKQRIKLLSKK